MLAARSTDFFVERADLFLMRISGALVRGGGSRGNSLPVRDGWGVIRMCDVTYARHGWKIGHGILGEFADTGNADRKPSRAFRDTVLATKVACFAFGPGDILMYRLTLRW